MASTESFRQHHKDLLKIASEISGRLNLHDIEKDPGTMKTMLSRLSGKVSVHLAMEDDSLYPELIAHKDAFIRAAADRLAKEVGGIKKAFAEYTRKWHNAEAIGGNATEFIRETRNIFSELTRRIEKEDGELYPLVEGITAKAS